MWSVGDLVVLTINKRDIAFSGEAAKGARSTYQKGHISPVSQGIRHFGDSVKVISQVQQYRQMLAMALEKCTPLSDAQLYGLAQWRGFNSQPTGPSMRPDQVPGAVNPPPLTRSSPETDEKPRTEPDRNRWQPNFGLSCLQLPSVLVSVA
ncbi:hypothetical protein BU15DRAFT_67300 [Melanogaster broomeanus]|nr:hypothetical protein BU15DRAFT_67300 [Melanogaster broomeanus]